MKSYKFLICASIVCGMLTVVSGCRNKSNPGNSGNPGPSSVKPDTTKMKPAGSDTSKVKPVSFAGDELVKRDYYFVSVG